MLLYHCISRSDEDRVHPGWAIVTTVSKLAVNKTPLNKAFVKDTLQFDVINVLSHPTVKSAATQKSKTATVSVRKWVMYNFCSKPAITFSFQSCTLNLKHYFRKKNQIWHYFVSPVLYFVINWQMQNRYRCVCMMVVF